MTREQISDFCVTALANILRISKDRVDIGTKFNRLGLDSAMVVYLMMELEEKLDLELITDDFYDHPTVEALSRFPRRQARGPPRRLRAARTGDIPWKRFRSLVALLARSGREQADERAYVFVSDRGAEEAALTFRELHHAAQPPSPQRLAASGAARRPRRPGVSARASNSWWRSSAA